MTSANYRVVRIFDDADLTSFACGEAAFDTWLANHAKTAVRAGVCAVYLLMEIDDSRARVVGYYAINPTQIARADTPTSFSRGWPERIPAWKIGKLAIHSDLRLDRASEWGRHLLRDALERIIRLSDEAGGKVIVVDAAHPSLLRFYTRNGFTWTGVEGDLSCFMKVSTARRHLQP